MAVPRFGCPIERPDARIAAMRNRSARAEPGRCRTCCTEGDVMVEVDAKLVDDTLADDAARALPTGAAIPDPGPPALSVVVPVHNEAGNIVPLLAEIVETLESRVAYEIVYVDDGSTDGTSLELAAARRMLPQLRVIRHRERCGQSTALRSGIKAAFGAWIVTLDGDGQNDPRDIPAMWAVQATALSGAIAVTGVRAARNDGIGKRWGSRLANRLRGWLLNDRARDTGCGIKLFPRAAFLDLPYFDHMHRFLPALFIRAGVEPIEHLVTHRPRTRGRSHYGLIDRSLVGLIDLFGVAWLQRRSARPVIEPEDVL